MSSRKILGASRRTLQPEKITYIIFWFRIHFPINYIAVTRECLSGIHFPKVTYHVFVCDSENYMEKRFGNYFLENLISPNGAKPCFSNPVFLLQQL